MFSLNMPKVTLMTKLPGVALRSCSVPTSVSFPGGRCVISGLTEIFCAAGKAREPRIQLMATAFLLGAMAPGKADMRQGAQRAIGDGFPRAAAGAPRMPALLQAYASRPPWHVAGVDYAVGVPAGTMLRDPTVTADLPEGALIDETNHLIRVTRSGVTLAGYDFALHGGYGVYAASHTANTVIENCNFRVGTNNVVPINAEFGTGSLAVRYSTFDGGGGQNKALWAMINYNGSGNFVAEYNDFHDVPNDAVDFNRGTMTTLVKYNLFDTLGTTEGSHPDPVQYVGVRSLNSVEAFNTIYQPNPGGMEGIQLAAQLGSALTNTYIENNVIVAKGPLIKMSYAIALIQRPENTIDGAVVANNFIDFSGAYGAFYPPGGGNIAFVDNVNMVTGARIASPPGTTSGNVTQLLAKSATPIALPGSTIELTVRLNKTAIVTGTPTLRLNSGGLAIFAGGSGSDALVFNYIVGASDKPVGALAVLQINLPESAEVLDGAGNAINLTGIFTEFPGISVGKGTNRTG